MNTWKTSSLRFAWTLVVFVVSACMACEGDRSTQGAVPDDQIGLNKSDITETPTPAIMPLNGSEPGERPVLSRAFMGAPPVIPHGVADFVPVGRDENACLECHMVEEKIEGEATPIPKSHYVDLRNAPSEIQPEVVGARYNCTTCHAPQTDAQPLVKNQFREPGL